MVLPVKSVNKETCVHEELGLAIEAVIVQIATIVIHEPARTCQCTYAYIIAVITLLNNVPSGNLSYTIEKGVFGDSCSLMASKP